MKNLKFLRTDGNGPEGRKKSGHGRLVAKSKV